MREFEEALLKKDFESGKIGKEEYEEGMKKVYERRQ